MIVGWFYLKKELKEMKKLLIVVLIGYFFSTFPPKHEVIDIYEVKPGDTLIRICGRYCSKDCRIILVDQMIEDIKDLNPYLKERGILPGDKIKIRYMQLDR